jgi:hypothetical protein
MRSQQDLEVSDRAEGKPAGEAAISRTLPATACLLPETSPEVASVIFQRPRP